MSGSPELMSIVVGPQAQGGLRQPANTAHGTPVEVLARARQRSYLHSHNK